MIGPALVETSKHGEAAEKRLIAVKLTHPEEAGMFIPRLSTLPLFGKIKPSNVESILHTNLDDFHVLIVLSGVSDDQILNDLLAPLRAMTDAVRLVKQATMEEVESGHIQYDAVKNEAVRGLLLEEAIITLELDAEHYMEVHERVGKIQQDIRTNPQQYHGIEDLKVNFTGDIKMVTGKPGKKITLFVKGVFGLEAAERLQQSEFNNEMIAKASVTGITPASKSTESRDTTAPNPLSK